MGLFSVLCGVFPGVSKFLCGSGIDTYTVFSSKFVSRLYVYVLVYFY